MQLGLSTGCVAQQREDDGLLRQSTGTLEYRTTDSPILRGTEHWTLMVHTDGARTLHAKIHNLEKGSRTQIIQRVDRDFQPLDVVIQGWSNDKYRGIGLFTVSDSVLEGLSRGPSGEGSHEVSLGENVTVLSHALAADAWFGIPADLKARGNATMTAYSIDLKPTAKPAFLGALMQAPIEWIGVETIAVPAGKFETTHLRLAGRFDVWIFGEDRTMARMLDEKSGRDYLLVEYTGPR